MPETKRAPQNHVTPKTPKRILHCLGWLSSGGPEQRRLLQSKYLPREDYKHLVICQEADGSIANLLCESGWEVQEIGVAHHVLDLRWHLRAYRLAKDFAPDIIYGSVSEGIALAVGVSLRMRRSKLVLEETSDGVGRRWTGNFFLRVMHFFSDRSVAVSPDAERILLKTLKVAKGKVHRIDNGVDFAPHVSKKELATMRNSLGIASSDFVVGSVGRLVDDHKCFGILLRSFEEVLRVHPSSRLLIVGDGPDREKLEEQATELGVKEATVFLGYRNDARRLYGLMDVFVLASARESFGLVLAEAMMSGIPVVATRVGGIPHVLDNGRAGILVEPNKPEEITEAVIRLMQNLPQRKELACRGFERAADNFSPHSYIPSLTKLWAELTD